MLVFIDDSGDPGFKLEKGSSRFFVIGLVIFDDPLEAEKAAIAIKELRRNLHFPDDMEFKYHKSRAEVKQRFFQTINAFKFRVRAFVVDKKLIHSDELKHNKNSFYSYAIKMVLKHSHGTILKAKLRIDGSGDRGFRRNFVAYLRHQLNSQERQIMEQCRLVDSKGNVLIQMADMISGCIRSSHDGGESFKGIIRKHIEDEWHFR